MAAITRGAPLDRLMRPLHQWVWSDVDRRLRKLLTFAQVETDGSNTVLWAYFVLTLLMVFVMWNWWRRARDQIMGGGILSGFARSPAKRWQARDKNRPLAGCIICIESARVSFPGRRCAAYR